MRIAVAVVGNISNICTAFFYLLTVLALTSCQRNAILLEPQILYTPQQRHIAELPSAFPTLSLNERETPWGREMLIGKAFAQELDLYRAITAFKRALVLIPGNESARRDQITYDIILCYYLGGKYQDAVETFENSELRSITPAFPAFGDLLLMLDDAYRQDSRFERAEAIRQLIERCAPETAVDLSLSEALRKGQIEEARSLAAGRPEECSVDAWMNTYCAEAKSVRRAQWLNALLPGAGYLYVGQCKTALTSFLLNALFIAATYQFFDRNYPAAALITLSLETGWYFGGINGAGLAAKEYNQHLYANYGKEALIETHLFPIMMFEYAF